MQKTQATLIKREYSPSWEVAFVTFQAEHIFPFSEGQFMMISSETESGKKLKKPYSIATTSRYFEQEKEIGCVVKQVGVWGMSEHLVSWLPIWWTVTLVWPVWHYVDSWEHPSYLFISVWSGLSPNVGLFDQLIHTQAFSKIVLIHGERFFSHHVLSLHERFTEISLSDERVSYIPVFSKEKNLPKWGREWYVQSTLDEALADLWNDCSCFLCGKPEMVDDVRRLLSEKWMDKEDITFEKY